MLRIRSKIVAGAADQCLKLRSLEPSAQTELPAGPAGIDCLAGNSQCGSLNHLPDEPFRI